MKTTPTIRLDFTAPVTVRDHDTDGLLVTDATGVTVLMTFGTYLARDAFGNAVAHELGMEMVWLDDLRDFTVEAAKLLGGRLIGPEETT